MNLGDYLATDWLTTDDCCELSSVQHLNWDPQVICLIRGFRVTVPATSGRQMTNCTASSSIPHALRHARIPPMYHIEDQATCSEHLTTTVFPEKSDARIGEIRLWNE